MHPRLRIGIVGSGRWGGKLVRTFGRLDSCEVAAICDTDPARLGETSLPPGAARYAETSDLLRDPSVRAVVIATPASLHAAQSIAALEAGRHVFVEKPMALSLREAHRMRDAAARNGCSLMVGHLLRYHPAILELRRAIEAGEIGEPLGVWALRMGPQGPRADEGPWWSLGPHDLSLARYLMNGEIAEIAAHQRDFADGVTETSAEVRLTTGVARLVVSNASPRKVRRLVVVGTAGAAVFDDGGANPILAIRRAPGALPEQMLAADLGADTAEGPGERRAFASDEPLLCEAAHFVGAIRNGTPIATDADEGCRIVAALDAGATSIANGAAWIRVHQGPSGRSIPRVGSEDRPR